MRHCIHLCLLTAVFVVVLSVSPAHSTTYTVLPDGNGDFPTIQAAIDAATDDDVIELGDGTFTGDGNRDIGFLGKRIKVCSASGDPEACVIDCQGSSEEPHRGFHFHSDEEGQSVLRGVTITGGFAEYGGAIRCDWASPTIRDVRISSNVADEGGGGMCCFNASPLLHRVRFGGNAVPGPVPYHCGRGGGLFSEGGAPTLDEVGFVGNSAWSTEPVPYSLGSGGGMYCDGPATLLDVDFLNNTAQGNGGGLVSHGFLSLTNVVFSGNRSDRTDGGGMFCSGSPILFNVLFENNVAFMGPPGSRPHSGAGGGLSCGAGSPTLTHVTFSGNRACIGGGGMSSIGSPTIVNCTFVDNRVAALGGGAAIESVGGSAAIVNCTFVGNYAEDPVGGTIFCGGSVVSLENTIIAFGTGGGAVSCVEGGSALLTCCDIFDNEGGDWVGPIADQYGVNGNMALDPVFCSDEHPEWPYTLHSNSPCAPNSPDNPICGLIGAWPIGCGPTIVEETTWGSIKAMYLN